VGTGFWDTEGCIQVDFLEKGTWSMQSATFRRSTNFVMSFVKNVGGRKLSSFKMTTRGLTLHVWPYRQFIKERPVTVLPSTLQSGFGPFRLTIVRPLKDHLRGQLYETDEAVQEAVKSWLRGAGTDFYFCKVGRNA
jgi:hypothetical protein